MTIEDTQTGESAEPSPEPTAETSPESPATESPATETAVPTPQSPLPSAKPIPRPVARPHPTARPLLASPASDPRKHGRVADDGTVFLITAAGERVVGSWQAGDAEAAYAHFGRRYDDLATEVTLMETRLAAGTGDARKIRAAATVMAESLSAANVLGDVDTLARRLQGIDERAAETAQAERARRDEQRATQTARKEALAVEAEDLAANATQWKTAGDRMRVIVDEWRTISGLDRKTDDALWKRYSAARDAFNRRRGAHFAELDRERVGVKETKERLCGQAEELSGSTDWAATAGKFRDLLNEWKTAGRMSKEADDALWQRFKAAQDTFFAARNAVSSEREAEFATNAKAKEKLLAEAEKIDVSKPDAARTALRAVTDKWDAVGNAPRDRSADLDRRLRAVEKKIRDAGETARADPEAQARAEQFRVRAEQFERQAAKAAAAGRPEDEAQALASATQWREWADTAAAAVTKSR